MYKWIAVLHVLSEHKVQTIKLLFSHFLLAYEDRGGRRTKPELQSGRKVFKLLPSCRWLVISDFSKPHAL